MQQFSNWVEKIQTILLNDLNMYFHVFEQMFKRLEILELCPWWSTNLNFQKYQVWFWQTKIPGHQRVKIAKKISKMAIFGSKRGDIIWVPWCTILVNSK